MGEERTPSWFVAIDWTGAGEHRFARAGSYELRAPLGRGGLGEVWRAFDRTRGVEVAVKFLVHEIAKDDRFHAALRREVRAVARLDHPGVVRVFTLGTLEADAEAASGGRIVAGSPFFAMELARGGTLATFPRAAIGAGEWALIARSLLEALAHAHARGVVHRDLKPSNVLLRASSSLDAGLVLSDFGLALVEGELHGEAPGTTAYAAPELSLGRRQPGRGADLYSLGVMLWELATGELPFGRELDAQARVLAQPRAFAPRFALPAGVAPWLARLLMADPRRRPSHAADAARALDEALGSSASIEVAGPADARPRSLLALALGTYGLGTLPIVGREEEQARLARALDAVARGGSCAVAVVGASGMGASRLARWLVERADERGVARTLRIDLDVREALARELGVLGAPPGAARTRALDAQLRGLAAEASESARAAWTGAIELVLDDAVDVPEQVATLLVYAARAARERPRIVWLDDADRAVVDAVLARWHALPEPARAGVLVLVSAHEAPRCQECGAEARRSDAPSRSERRVVAEPVIQLVALGPLDEAARRTLFGRVLGLAAGLIEELDRVAAGSPGVALAELARLADEGRLVAGEGGTALRPARGGGASGAVSARGARESVPGAPRELLLWEALTPSESDALGVGALLGARVAEHVWREAAASVGATVGAQLLDRLAMERVAEHEAGVWRFASEAMRRSIVELALAGPRGAALARAAADALARQGGPRALGARAAILARVGGRDEAIDALHDAAARRLRALDFEGARRDAEALEPLARERALPATDARVVRTRLVRAAALRALGRLDEAAALVREVHRAVRAEAPALAAEAAHQRARIERALGDSSGAMKHLLEAERHARLAGAHTALADVLADQAAVLASSGAEEAALERLSRASSLYDAAGARVGVGVVRWMRGRIARRRGRWAEAEQALASAVSELRAAGKRGLAAEAESELADVAMLAGEHARAELLQERALEALVALGHEAATMAELRLGVVLATRGELERASMHLEGATSALAASGRAEEAAAYGLALAVCALDEGDGERADALVEAMPARASALLGPHAAHLVSLVASRDPSRAERVRARLAE